MNGGPSGFGNAPVTRAFIAVSAIFTLFLGIQGRSSKLGLSYQDVFGKLRVWKLIMSLFSFSSTPELMFGLYLLYYFRVFERQMGSNKFSVFILFSSIVSLLFEVLSLALLKGATSTNAFMIKLQPKIYNHIVLTVCISFIPSIRYQVFLLFTAVLSTPLDIWNVVTSGPYGLIFASFIPFFFDIPVSTQFRVFGLRFSDKFFIYLAGVQLLLSSWRRSILPGLCGILAGSLYRLNFLRIRKAKIPEVVVAFFSRFSWLSDGSPPSASSRNVMRNVPPFTAHQAERNYPRPLAAAAEPSEDTISTLVSMGFERDSARQALVHAQNDVNMATNILLEAQSH